MDKTTLQQTIQRWYRANRRPLPWRDETDPYRIWVSEVMLQQTQVTAVMPYYQKFLARFPTVAALAAAPVDEVLKAWEGLGYYARARNLHRAARDIVARFDGRLPQTRSELLTLPGFGAYTAGAVASIAFGEPVPAVDGNVKRVISRLFAIEDDITTAPGRNRIQAIATEMARTAAVSAEWTQALMELGAVVCAPARPRCLLCPAGNGLCRARAAGLAESLPVKPRKKPVPHYNVAAGVIYKTTTGPEFLIAQRPLEGMLGGLWEFPGGKQEPSETLPHCLQREIREELNIEIAVDGPVTVVNHAFTHFKITLHAFFARLIDGCPQKIGVANWAWVTLETIDRFAFGRADRKIIAALRRLAAENTLQVGNFRDLKV